eukprot:522174-Rhodomonas_salina.3
MVSTAPAIIILPVVANVGKSIKHPAAIIIASVLMDSAASKSRTAIRYLSTAQRKVKGSTICYLSTA